MRAIIWTKSDSFRNHVVLATFFHSFEWIFQSRNIIVAISICQFIQSLYQLFRHTVRDLSYTHIIQFAMIFFEFDAIIFLSFIICGDVDFSVERFRNQPKSIQKIRLYPLVNNRHVKNREQKR